jgi:hypothetical protein
MPIGIKTTEYPIHCVSGPARISAIAAHANGMKPIKVNFLWRGKIKWNGTSAGIKAMGK